MRYLHRLFGDDDCSSAWMWIMVIVAIGLIVSVLLFGCDPLPQGGMVMETRPDILHTAPPPESAAQGVDLQIKLDHARGEIDRLRLEAEAEADRLRERSAAEASAMRTMTWAARGAFLAVIPAYLLGGWRTAMIAAVFATALSLAPGMAADAWQTMRGPVKVIGSVCSAAYGAYWLGQLWRKLRSDHEQDRRFARARDEQLIGGHYEGAAATEILRRGVEDDPYVRKEIAMNFRESQRKAD